jgi:hypothetical protein
MKSAVDAENLAVPSPIVPSRAALQEFFRRAAKARDTIEFTFILACARRCSGAVDSKGKPVEELSRRLGLPVYKLEEWRHTRAHPHPARYGAAISH